MDRPRTPAPLRVLTGAVLAALVAVSATGCARDEGLSGMGLPTLPADEQVDAEQVSFEGVLHVGPRGCLMVRLTGPAGESADRWTVWPTGSEQVLGTGETGNGALVDGRTYADGDRITGTGRLVALEALPDGESGYSQSSGRYCDAAESGVLVVDELRRA